MKKKNYYAKAYYDCGNCWAVIADNNYETFLRNFNKIRRMK